MRDWVQQLLAYPAMAKQGHCQRPDDDDLGLGWIYYGLARVIRPPIVVVVGSYRGFVPLVLARALADNGEGGVVHFIDPSLVDDFWKDADQVRAHFAAFGITNIVHHLQTTQEFIRTDAYRSLSEVGLLFLDGYHTQEQAEFDFNAFRDQLTDTAAVLFHDSIDIRTSKIYGPDRHYTHTVKRLIDRLKQDDGLQVLDLPFGSGVSIVRASSLPDAAPSTQQ